MDEIKNQGIKAISQADANIAAVCWTVVGLAFIFFLWKVIEKLLDQ